MFEQNVKWEAMWNVESGNADGWIRAVRFPPRDPADVADQLLVLENRDSVEGS